MAVSTGHTRMEFFFVFVVDVVYIAIPSITRVCRIAMSKRSMRGHAMRKILNVRYESEMFYLPCLMIEKLLICFLCF